MAADQQACFYCGERPATRLDPFGLDPSCDQCVNVLIGGEPDDPPFRCGNDPATTPKDPQ
jgi:hypothetical protein